MTLKTLAVDGAEDDLLRVFSRVINAAVCFYFAVNMLEAFLYEPYVLFFKPEPSPVQPLIKASKGNSECVFVSKIAATWFYSRKWLPINGGKQPCLLFNPCGLGMIEAGLLCRLILNKSILYMFCLSEASHQHMHRGI